MMEVPIERGRFDGKRKEGGRMKYGREMHKGNEGRRYKNGDGPESTT